MGILGLLDFIAQHEKLEIKNYRLCDTTLIICGSNLVYRLAELSQRPSDGRQLDRVGGDMVMLARKVRQLFAELKRCNIKSILVMGGAYRSHDSSDEQEIHAKLDREIARFAAARNLASLNFGSSKTRNFVIPKLAFSVFRSVVTELIALDYDIKFHQCMFSLVLQEISRLAHKHKCPILTDDTVHSLLDLPDGIIRTFDFRLHNMDTRRFNTHIRCSLYKRSRFRRYMEDLKEENLSLLQLLDHNQYGSLFDRYGALERFYDELPNVNGLESKALEIERLKQTLIDSGNKDRNLSYQIKFLQQAIKIEKLLNFLRGKSLQENIDCICAYADGDKETLREKINSYLKRYEVPCEDKFKDELKKLCREGFYADHSATDDDDHSNLKREELDKLFERKINRLSCYLRAISEQSILAFECFDLMHRNTIHIKPQVDDSTLSPSSNYWLLKATKIILRLVRTSKRNSVANEPCKAYDRVGRSYERFELVPESELEHYGLLDYTIFDLPNLDDQTRRDIVLSTFYMNEHELNRILLDCGTLTELQAREIIVIKLLLRFIDLERLAGDDGRLWPEFKLAILMSMIHFFVAHGHPFFQQVELMNGETYEQMRQEDGYDKFIVYQITQLQATIFGYNSLNSLLGEPCPRVRSENWFNSCFIYNVTKDLRDGRLIFVNQLSDFIDDI